MTLKKYISLISAVLLVSVLTTKAQINNAEASFNQYQQKNLREKLFVHTDKSTYVAGEILWFKIYNTDGSNKHLLAISKVAYVDILDKANNPVIQAKIALKGGTGSGSVFIPINITTASYKLRAYTNWMKNSAPDFYFEKPVAIINPLRSPDAQTSTPIADYDVQFFPEGGTLLNQVSNKVGFKIMGSDGKSAMLNGAIVNQRNDTIVRFKPLRFGLGSFLFTPKNGNSYRAVFRAGNKTFNKPLPAIAGRGYAMITTTNGDDITVQVNSSSSNETMYLLAYNGTRVSNAQSINLNNGSAEFKIDRKKLDEGITHLTVFNTNRQPVSERLLFKRPHEKLTIQPVTDNTDYTSRKKVSLAIGAQDQNGKAVATNLSVSVFRLDSLQEIEQEDIQSYLWLRSELKGYIQNSAYYFTHNDAATDEALDNLLLTQGWRQFDWNDIFNNKAQAFNFLPEYNGHIITAKIFSNADNKPAPGVIAYLGVPAKRVQLYTAISDSSGRLSFNTHDLFGPGEIVLQTNMDKDSTYHIEAESPFSEQYTTASYPALHINAVPEVLLSNYNLYTQVQNVYAGNRLRQFYDPGADSAAFYFKPYKTYLLDQFTRFPTMEEVLREYVTELNLAKTKNRYHIKTIGQAGVIGFDPLVLVDGVPVFNTNKLISIDPLKVRKLEVVPARYFYGPTVNDGIFSFTTYKGDLGGLELDPSTLVVDYEGLQLQRKFYSPVYDTEAEMKSHLPDFRNVLYWQPDTGTDASGKNTLSFYTSDFAGRYMIVVQGISATGETGSGYTTFEVKK